MARKVVIVGFSGVQALDVVGPHDVFTTASLLTGGGYDVVVASADGQQVATASGLAFGAGPLPDPNDPVDTVVLPGGGGVEDARTDSELVTWIKAVAGTARRIVTVCTGAFLAAEAGLLDGCRVTTHWAFAGRLAREFPAVDVDPDPIFVRSSDTVWTAAGVTAGIDLALSLVEDDHGTEVAQTVARLLVLYLRRPGGQTQFAAPVWMPRAKRTSIREVQDAIEAEPGGSHSIGELARRATMSPATSLGCSLTRSARHPATTSNVSAPKPRADSWKRPTTPLWRSRRAAASVPRKPCGATSFAASASHQISTARPLRN